MQEEFRGHSCYVETIVDQWKSIKATQGIVLTQKYLG